ncbi:hypothetical protein C0992_009604 [Termitomyces sp. T32_za158]|nr:hypothetical protein C0992_009604 [Termitomyces sp. T32_za158]
MSLLLSKFLTPKPSPSPPSIKPCSTASRRVHFVDDVVEPPSSLRAKLPLEKSEDLPLSSYQSLPEHFKSMLKTEDHGKDHGKEPANYASPHTALGSVRPKLTRLFIGPLKSSPSTNDANTIHEGLSPPSSAVTSGELGTMTLASEKCQEPSSADSHPEICCGPLPNGRSEAITTWVEQSLDEYAEPGKSEYRRWVHTQRVVEWRRYRSRHGIARCKIGAPDRHEILVVKVIGRSKMEAIFLRFERYKRDRSIDCAKGGNYRPLDWQRWCPDDRVTMLDGWPDKCRYMRCEGQVFQREHKVSFMDLLIAVHLAVEAPWTDFWTRHSHWFAVLLGRTLNGKMEKIHRLEQPVAIGVAEKYGETPGWDWFRASTRHERRKIVELIHLCSVARHREKVRLYRRRLEETSL